jgi:hypothetical protein
VRSLDGHLFCNRGKARYWQNPVREGGCGLGTFDDCEVIDYLDGDRPAQFANDDFSGGCRSATEDPRSASDARSASTISPRREGIHVHV